MGSLVKSVAVVAALSVLVVLLTPAFDELPCPGCHKSASQLLFIARGAWTLLEKISRAVKPACIALPLFHLHDLRSLTCTFLC